MVVKIKDVGKYIIYVKETTTVSDNILYLWALPLMVLAIILFSVPIITTNPLVVPIIICSVIAALGIMPVIVIITTCNPPKCFLEHNYCICTTYCNINDITIRKTTPAQDHIAICRAAQKIEKEILEYINKEKELEDVVGKCK